MAILALIVAAGIWLLIHMLKEAFSNTIVEQDLYFGDFPKSFGKISIFFISDIHRRTISERIVQNVKGRADLVIIGGDLLEKGVSIERVKENVKKLKEIGPVYFVWGNNDYEVDYHELDAVLLESKVKILDNTAVIFESEEGEKLSLLGVDDYTLKRDRLDYALQDADAGSFKILASHNPKIVKKISKEDGISLVLSGHTHGGQIHLFGFSPQKRGKTEVLPNTTIVISNGFGTTTIPLRLGAPAQTHFITLKPKEE